jgi:hypothetical protein
VPRPSAVMVLLPAQTPRGDAGVTEVPRAQPAA